MESILSHTEPVHTHIFISARSILMISFHLLLCLSNRSFPSNFSLPPCSCQWVRLRSPSGRYWQGKTKELGGGGQVPVSLRPPQIPQTDSGSNLGLRSERASSHLNRGTMFMFMLIGYDCISELQPAKGLLCIYQVIGVWKPGRMIFTR
jgi:hypothetical protein